MSRLFILSQPPCADLDWAVEWGEWLGDDTLTKSTFTVTSGTGLTIHTESISGDDAVFWVKGGTLGQQFEVKNYVETAAARKSCRIIRVEIVNKP